MKAFSKNQLQRYPVYLKFFKTLLEEGKTSVSSPYIAKCLGYSEEQIRKDDGGLGDQRPGDGSALLGAAGEHVGKGIQIFLKPEEPCDPLEKYHVRPGVVQGKREEDVLPYSQIRYQIIFLKDESYLSAAEDSELVFVKGRKIDPVHDDGPFCGAVEPADQIQESGLSGTGSADDGGEPPFFYSKVNAVHGLNLLISCTKIFFCAF